ncbi:MAG TPA: polyphosphate kinase 1 [Pyrinomonadaceae bacterium]|nr:polyphosphate kinase 1 [Pyrinomonadaceae bacterium]
MAASEKQLPPMNEGQAESLPASLLHRKEYLFNRELSWVEFNRRVLEEALDETQPLLERLKFLAIFSSNLDEFFMVRVSGLMEQFEDAPEGKSSDGMTPAEQLKEICERLHPMVAEQTRCLHEDVLPKLREHGVRIKSHKDLTEKQRREGREYFLKNVFPILTPQAVDPSHPFPYISNLSLNVGVMVGPASGGKGRTRFARIKIPPSIPRLVPLKEPGLYTFLGSLIGANLDALFPGMKTSRGYVFRVTRDADFEIREDDAGDLLRAVKQILRQRRFGFAVRLEVSATMPPDMIKFLQESLELGGDDVYVIDGALNVPDLMPLYNLDLPELKDQPLRATIPARLKGKESIFEVIKAGDVLLHHPYTSYSTVVNFIDTAAEDPDVLAIKICLYRTGKDSPIVKALMKASEAGKQVTALVELKARFDEENNIEWAQQLERAGVHVVHGMLGLKTHCKVALVVRREKGNLQRYVHLATGNYNPTTSRIYTDLGLLTANEEFGADVTDLFNFLTGYSGQTEYRQLLVAPANMRGKMRTLIDGEIAAARRGRPARIIAKINSLTDLEIIRKLYEASGAGVEIDLIVRGVCSLRPGVPGLSERITVTSVVGRFLEHSRLYYFASGGEEEILIGSADWMSRNLDRRVEVVAPVHDPQLKKYLKNEILDHYLRDNVKARRLRPDGVYEKRAASANEERFDSQLYFSTASPA